jgi:hypothetical protein
MLWFGDVFVEGGFGPLEMIETGSVDQETYINVLISRFHPWFTNVTMHQERDLSSKKIIIVFGLLSLFTYRK